MNTQNCPFIVENNVNNPPSTQEFLEIFKKGKLEEKKTALKQLMKLISNDEQQQKLILPVLQNLSNTDDHELKKLMFLYWELIDKLKPDNSLKDEILLSCNSLRKDLLHENEFIRGHTLKLLSKMMIKGIIEPLLQVIIENINFRHSFVRRNAYLCLIAIYKNFGTDFLVGLSEKVESLLPNESDISTKRNAFVLLYHIDREKAINYIKNTLSSDDGLNELGDIVQIAILELIRKSCIADPTQKGRLLEIVIALSQSKHSSVLFECATTILYLSIAPTALKIAISCYLKLIANEGDNNVLLIVLNKLKLLSHKSQKILEENLPDLLPLIHNKSKEIKENAIDLIYELSSERHLKDICNQIKIALKKEITDKFHREMLLQIINKLTDKFPSVSQFFALELIDRYLILEFEEPTGKEKKSSLSFEQNDSYESAQYLKKVLLADPNLSKELIPALIDRLPEIKSMPTLRVCVGLIGEYCNEISYVHKALDFLIENLNSPLIIELPQVKTEPKIEAQKMKTKTVILPDGTYATQIINEDSTGVIAEKKENTSVSLSHKGKLRLLFEGEDLFSSSILAHTFARLILKTKDDPSKYNQYVRSVLTFFYTLLKNASNDLTNRSHKEKISLILKALLAPESQFSQTISKAAINIEKENRSLRLNTSHKKSIAEEKKELVIGVDEPIIFRQLKGHHQTLAEYESFEAGEDFSYEDKPQNTLSVKDKHSKVYCLTGQSGNIYAEAVVDYFQYSINMNVMVTNKTNKTLQNLLLEIFSREEVKLIEKPSTINIPPNATKTIRAQFRTSATEEGFIFGYIIYQKGVHTEVLPLAQMAFTFLDIIYPETCSETKFKKMWSYFVWENKYSFDFTKTLVLSELAYFIKDKLNMYFVTPINQEENLEIEVLNLYGKSKFGEDLLMNMTMELVKDKINCQIKIRSKTKSMALVFGQYLINLIEE